MTERFSFLMIPSGNSLCEDYRNQLSVTATGLTVIPKKD